MYCIFWGIGRRVRLINLLDEKIFLSGRENGVEVSGATNTSAEKGWYLRNCQDFCGNPVNQCNKYSNTATCIWRQNIQPETYKYSVSSCIPWSKLSQYIGQNNSKYFCLFRTYFCKLIFTLSSLKFLRQWSWNHDFSVLLTKPGSHWVGHAGLCFPEGTDCSVNLLGPLTYALNLKSQNKTRNLTPKNK